MTGAAVTVEAPLVDGTDERRVPQPYMHPYFAGIGIGAALLAAFVVVGRGLGASGAFSSVVSVAVAEAAPAHAAGNGAYAPYLGDGTHSPFADWLVFEIIGVTIGGFLSAWLGGRFRFSTECGPRMATRQRLAFALAGGVLMGFGAKLARGCTSGLALTGGALLAPGAWIFIGAAFAAGFAAAPLLRRQWL
jgi:uncharacterized protein